MDDDDIDATEITIDVKNGEVTRIQHTQEVRQSRDAPD